MMKYASAMVGNSSSGIIEAPSFKLPVVNIGARQDGRIRSANIVDCGHDRNEILRAMRKALSENFAKSLKTMKSPYGDGHAAEKIVRILKKDIDPKRLLVKKFDDLSEK